MSKKFRKIPRILKINDIDSKQLCISVLFNNGENRLLDFKKIFEDWNIQKTDPEYPLLNAREFGQVTLENETLTWNNIIIHLSGKEGEKITAPYDIGADTLYKFSVTDVERSFSIGTMLRKLRLEAMMTQEELAERSGTTRTYITKIENDKQDIEISTFRRIVEAGLHKKLKISIE